MWQTNKFSAAGGFVQYKNRWPIEFVMQNWQIQDCFFLSLGTYLYLYHFVTLYANEQDVTETEAIYKVRRTNMNFHFKGAVQK